MLTLTLEDGSVRTAVTGAFGYYRFDDIPGGQTVVLEISAKRYTFNSPVRLIQMSDDISGLDWTSN